MEKKIDAILSKMDTMEKRMSNFESAMSNLEANMSTLNTQVLHDVKQLSDRMDGHQQSIEFLERKVRQRNLIVFGLPESVDPLEAQVLSLFKEVLRVPCSTDELEYTGRLGKQSNRNRPVLVEFVSFKKKQEIYARRADLPEGLHIRNDIAPSVRARWAEERQGAQSKNSKRDRPLSGSSGSSVNSPNPKQPVKKPNPPPK
ncbi:Hypothetical protein NTJ_06444 [Nesidiocoris tenuis]|uniref:RRM domain-containing protein n=1 Tax=Nesidiocoris tenuis TaxID=355587 RepID=A0ABN7AN37_9HEMI|nr:Hypothetical protein NTJ_06444 [Nesidiocoris tenuis]